MVNLEKIVLYFRLFRKAFGHYKIKILYMAILGFISGFVGGIGIGAIVPLFSFVSNNQTGATDRISQLVEKFFSLLHLNYNLTSLIIFISLLFVIKAVFIFFANYINTRIVSDYEMGIRSNLLNKTLSANWPYLIEQKVGHLETILNSDAARASGVLDVSSSIILLSASLLAYSAVAFSISANITLVTLGSGVVLFFILKPLFYRTRKISYFWAKISKAMANHVAEYIIGSKTIKIMVAEKMLVSKIQKYFDELRETRIKLLIYSNLQSSLQEPISLILIVSIFALSYSRPEFEFASFLAVVYLVQKMFSFMQSIQSRLSSINEALPFLKTIIDYEELATQHVEETGTEKYGFSFDHKLKLDNVKFKYGERSEVLSGVTFEINKGEMVGLIGPSGAGKTTVVDLILKLFHPSTGKILLDGIDLSEINTAVWRGNIGYVSQDMFLLSDTIENNIRFYDPKISQTDMIEASKMANIYDTIQELPDKFSSVVGERGLKLSVGQRQRIVLARVLARQPKILILDEATSALDNESESLIQKTLEKLKNRVTILVIAHRLSTVMGCDKLVVLEGGQIIEQGSPDELLKNQDSYFYKTYSIGAR